MTITFEIQKTKKALTIAQQLSDTILSMDSGNWKVRDELLAKVDAIREELIKAEVALEDLHS